MKGMSYQFVTTFFGGITLVFMLVFSCAYFVGDVYAQEEQEAVEETEEERKEREEKEEELEEDLEKYEKKLKSAQEEKDAAQQKLNVQHSALTSQRHKLAQTEEAVSEKDAEILQHNSEIEELGKKIDLHESVLSSAVRQLYISAGNDAVANILGKQEKLPFGLGGDRLSTVREKIAGIMIDLDHAKQEVHTKKEQAAQAKKEKEELLSEQKKQEQSIAYQASLAQVDVKRASATVSELNAKMSAIQSKLSDLLGEGVSLDDIEDAAKFASGKTGVRKDFILGMLVVETDLGRYTGGCTYKESRMSDYRKDIFKKIAKELDKNYKKLKVSCPPSRYKGTGGAMGVAQFMSDTWWGYKDRIAAKTKNYPPDPWDLTDGVMAMALKLANDGATKKSGEWGAAARYLGTCSTANTKFYCENVLYWADNYEKKL